MGTYNMIQNNRKQIKFRAWIEGEMILEPLVSVRGASLNSVIASYEHLMQYTGLKDKNGVEIYEGDIVRLRDINWEVRFEIYDDSEQWANYKHFGWTLKHNSSEEDPELRETLIDEHMNCNIVGNIYETSEIIGDYEHD